MSQMTGGRSKLSIQYIVIKIGGAGVDSPAGIASLAHAIKSAQKDGFSCVIVHGGGQQLTTLGTRLGIPSQFVAGRRVTDDALITAAKMAFAGQVGTDLAAGLWAHGIKAASLSGVDAGCVLVNKRPPVKVALEPGQESQDVDYGWVGDIERVETAVMTALADASIVPLLASLGVDSQGLVYNVNADTIAYSLAQALGAERLVLLTDVDGVYADRHDPGTRFPRLALDEIDHLVTSGQVGGGMLPKLNAVAQALHLGVKKVHMVSWQDALALEDALCAREGRGTVFET